MSKTDRDSILDDLEDTADDYETMYRRVFDYSSGGHGVPNPKIKSWVADYMRQKLALLKAMDTFYPVEHLRTLEDFVSLDYNVPVLMYNGTPNRLVLMKTSGDVWTANGMTDRFSSFDLSQGLHPVFQEAEFVVLPTPVTIDFYPDRT